MRQVLGLGIDVHRCIGCYSCITSCKMENGIPLGIFLNRVTKAGPAGKFPKVEMHYLFKACMQCQKPPCLPSCPTEALSQRDDGIVMVNADKCDGCKECLEKCPYHALSYLEEKNLVVKCSLCAHRLDRGLEPMCVTTCMTEALVFGDLNDPNNKMAQLAAKAGSVIPLARYATEPANRYWIQSHLALEQLDLEPF